VTFPSADDTFTILPKDLEAANFIYVRMTGRLQPLHSTPMRRSFQVECLRDSDPAGMQDWLPDG
jgi:hypothetical protein